MNKLDLIIEKLEKMVMYYDRNENIDIALAAARELRALEPVCWMEDSIELYVQDCPSETYTVPLYRLDEVTK
jgi:hypothetical protein